MASRNGAATLPKVLDAYCRLAAPNGGWRLLVVDNGSTDGTPGLLAAYADRLPLQVLHEPQPGKNRALNRALTVALALEQPDDALYIFTDDDAAPAPDWLLQWQACAAAHADYSVFGGAITPDWAAPPPDWLLPLVPTGLTYGLTSPSLPDGPVFPGLVWGANMAVRRRVFAVGHRFDLCIGPNGAEYAMGSETELTRRLGLAGYRAWFCGAAQVAHHIRRHQVRMEYILLKSWRFGRGQFRQQRPGRFIEWFGVPRWMLMRFLLEVAELARAALLGDVARKFRHRWELAFLRGYFYEAWRGVPRAQRTVLVSSYSGELGGMELRMAQEVRYLHAAGYTGMLAMRRFGGVDEWARRLAAEQIVLAEFSPPEIFEGGWRWRTLRLLRARLAARRLRAFQAGLVHVAFCWTNYGASILWMATHCGLPSVISVHNAFPPTVFTDWHDKLLHRAFGGVRGVYAVSDSALAHFMTIYRPYLPADARLAVIPNSVDTECFKPSIAAREQARQRWQLPQPALVIGVVARLSAQKRPAMAIQVFALLRARFPTLYLVLAGTGPLESVLREQVTHMGLLPWVIFTGFVEAVHELMPALDVHLLMSRNEGFGISTIEAMACGVPAVATDVPGSADILRGSPCGLLVPADAPSLAAEAIAALLADPVRRADMGRLGRAEAVRRYSNAVVGQQVRAFYDGLL
ncbi:glycosyltransferase [Duganella sp. FT94W]|uniref:Glycosyltransferase n=2 Tax=Duganella lactea TaxID=2692173 RepID=A0ABW9V5P7_9BURK|nr:glycosyltransferase [Duganella lactea]